MLQQSQKERFCGRLADLRERINRMEVARALLRDHGEGMLRWAIGVCAAALLVVPIASANGMSRSEDSLLHQMNVVRAQYGLPSLQPNDRLEDAARAHSRAMLASDTFAHGALISRLAAFGVNASVAGENLAWAGGRYATPHEIVAMWLASPEHRANLLRPTFTKVGIGNVVGTFKGYSGVHVVTVDFAN